jgi:replicative DNA helicase
VIASLDHGEDGASPTEKIRLVVVDYLQLPVPMDDTAATRQQELAEICAGLKRFAEDLDVAVLAVSQLPSALGSAVGERPALADIRSPEISESADTVFCIHRPGCYRPDDEDPSVAEIMISAGPAATMPTVRVRYSPECVRLDDLPA